MRMSALEEYKQHRRNLKKKRECIFINSKCPMRKPDGKTCDNANKCPVKSPNP